MPAPVTSVVDPPAAGPPRLDRLPPVTVAEGTTAPRRTGMSTNEPTVRAILRDAAPAAVARPPAKTAWACGGASAVLLWACFYPLAWGPLAWAALVPLALLARSPVRTRWEVRALWVCGFVGTACQIQWMRLGDPAMYPAWLALSLYLGLYFPAFVLACRGLVHRAGVPFAVAVPVVWCGLELLRGRLMTGFGWNLLAHSQFDWTTLIQVADLGGVYLVSAVVALGNAALALTVPRGWLERVGLLPGGEAGAGRLAPRFAPTWSAVGAAAVLGGVLLYGTVRRGGAAFPAGPRVALVQTDHPSGLRTDPALADGQFTATRRLSAAATPYRPDLVVWPESAFPYPLFAVRPDVTEAQFAAAAAPIAPPEYFRSNVGATALASLAEASGAHLLTGLTAGEIADPDGPAGPLPAGFTRYGSAAVAAPAGAVGPDGFSRGKLLGRYDKRHRVVFGEYIPLREELPFLAALTPFTEVPGQPIGIGRGAGAVAFEIDAAGTVPDDGQPAPTYTVAPLICYEDTVPHLVRDTVNALEGGDGPDLLAVLSNDGWFDDSAEQQQHLAVSLFRAVETRTPLVRASNTGVSAVIDGDGAVRRPAVYLNAAGEPTDGPALPDDVACVLIADVPLDPRGSPYLLWGDWLGFLCAAAACVGLVLNLRRTHPG